MAPTTYGEAMADPKSAIRKQIDKHNAEWAKAKATWTEADWLRYIQNHRP